MPLDTPIRRRAWELRAVLTEAAGMKIVHAHFRGRRAVWEASLPYVTVDHQRQDVGAPDEDGADVHGPIWIPLGERTLRGPVRMLDFHGGFELVADFAAGPFRYTQLWRFHEDGRLAPWLTIHGPGIHDAHTYHAHWRFDFDVGAATDDSFEVWRDGGWVRVAEEGWLPHTGATSPEGYAWRQVDFASGASIGLRPQRWEDAEVFALRYPSGEWGPFSPRGPLGEHPAPAAAGGAASLDGEDVTLWYVAHVHHDQAFPFTAGPWVRLDGY